MKQQLYFSLYTKTNLLIACILCSMLVLPVAVTGQCDSIEASICEEAIEIPLQNFCGRTSNNAINIHGQGFCGPHTAIHNPDYFLFTALSDSVAIDIVVLPCYTGVGLQAAIFDECSWGTGWEIMDHVLACDPGTAPGGIMHLSAGALTVGNNYILMVDGSSGAECSYLIKGTSGLFAPYDHEISLQQSSDTIHALGGENFGYVWFSCEENLPLGTESFFVPPSDGCYCVEVSDGENSSVFCTTATTTSTTDPTGITPVTFFPNPSSDVVEMTIPSHSGQAHTLYVYDSQGRLTDVDNIATGSHAYWWKSNQQEGIYLFMVVSDHKTIGYQRIMHRK